MSVYLHDIPQEEANRRLQLALEGAGLWQVLGAETIPLDEHARGRVLAEPVWARISSPHYHASAMDGFAVRAADTTAAGPSDPLVLEVGSAARYLDTGDPLPAEFDAVIPIESIEALDNSGEITRAIRSPVSVRIRAAVVPWSHVRPLGEDIVATQLVLARGHTLRPADLGAAAAAGHTQVTVARRPRVAILPTGSELVPIGAEVTRGSIIEYNSLVMAAQIAEMGGEAQRYSITPDDFDLICARVREAVRGHDLILLNAGSSAGAEDFSARVVAELGSLLVHGVAVRPGHPVILGMIHLSDPGEPPRSVPIIGVPGYPVSAALTVELFAEPLMARWLGRQPREWPLQAATLTRKIVSPGGDDDYVRVALGKVSGKVLAAPLSRGAGVITSLSQADGLLLLPRGEQGAEAGREVQVRMLRPSLDLERTIFSIGSHDVIMDLLAQFLAERGRRLISINVGSLGGLRALQRGEAHLAGTHLLDPDSGRYNLRYIRDYLAGTPIRLVALVGREQGLIVPKGNPAGLAGLGDLVRPGVRFINRQRGAGTRVLLDYELGLLNIRPEQIAGYGQEEYTHLAVAAAVASGRADCGLGIPAAAQALGLDFVPLFHERYDLAVPLQFAQEPLLAPLFEVMADPRFRQEVAALPGYDVSVMGKVIMEA